MLAEDLLKTGDLSGALAALQDRARADPSDAKLRVFLFQLLCVTGDWSRAVNQLKVAAQLDALAIPMAQTYREAIVCEMFREKVFAGEKEPLVFGDPAQWVALMIEALRRRAAGQADEALDLRARAFEAAPEVPGSLNGKDFAWIADADMRLGPILEMILNGCYYWVPFSALRRVEAEAPADLRDAVWMPVTVALATGADLVGLIPTRYPETAVAGSEAEKMSRATRWQEPSPGSFTGIGQRLLTTDVEDFALMDLRELALEPVEAAASDV